MQALQHAELAEALQESQQQSQQTQPQPQQKAQQQGQTAARAPARGQPEAEAEQQAQRQEQTQQQAQLPASAQPQRSPSSDAESSMDLVVVLYAVPELLECLPASARRSLAAANKQLRAQARLAPAHIFKAANQVACQQLESSAQHFDEGYTNIITYCMDSMESEEDLSSAVPDLLSRPYSHLTEVAFGSNTLSTDCIASIAQAEWPHLKYLQLKTGAPGLPAMQMLAQADWPSLESLYLIDLPEFCIPCRHSKSFSEDQAHDLSTDISHEVQGNGYTRGKSSNSEGTERQAVLKPDGMIPLFKSDMCRECKLGICN